MIPTRDPSTEWQDWAICHEVDPDLFFAEPHDPTSSRRAKSVCGGCPVTAECRGYAIEHGLLGVWGGTTEEERRPLRRVDLAA